MVLSHLTDRRTYEQTVSGLNLLTTPENLANCIDAFLLCCRVEGLSKYTLKNYRYQLNAFLNFSTNIRLVKEVTTQHIRLFLLKLQEKNSPISVGDYYKSVKRFFNWMVEEGLLEHSPMAKVHSPRPTNKIVKPFSLQDIDNLLILCSLNSFLHLRNRAIILVFIDTGLRLSELAGINLVDVDFDREVIKVMGKGARERVVRVGRTAQKALLKYLLLRDDKYPCLWVTEERKPLSRYGIQTMIKILCRRAGIKDAKWGPHSFRHTFGTQSLLNGADIREVQSLLGHSTLKTTLTYVATVKSEEAIKRHKDFSPVDRFFGK